MQNNKNLITLRALLRMSELKQLHDLHFDCYIEPNTKSQCFTSISMIINILTLFLTTDVPTRTLICNELVR